MKTIKYIFLTNCLLFFHLSLSSQNLSLQFKHLKVEDGLSQTSVFTVFQDSRGFLWFGTRDGLNKYNTKSFTVYRNQSNDSTSIDNNHVYYMHEDDNKRLFIGTVGGLNEYIYEKDNFRKILLERDKENRLVEPKRITSIISYDDQLWVARDFLRCIDKNTLEEIRVFDDTNSPLTYNSSQVLLKDGANTLWIGTSEGLFKIDDLEKPILKKCNAPTAYDIRDIKKLDDDKLLLGTRHHGLIIYNIDNGSTEFLKDRSGKNILSDIYVRSIFNDITSNLIWIGAFDGLYIYDLNALSVTHYQNSPDNPRTLSNNSILSIIKDKKGSFWLGTYYGGVNYWDVSNNNFEHYTSSELKSSLSHPAVGVILEDSISNLWIGTEGGGLNYFDRKNNRFTHYKSNKDDATSISSNNVKSMLLDSKGNFWVGTYQGGLNKFSIKDRKFTNNKNSNAPIYHLAENVYNLVEDIQGRLWLGSLDNGLFSIENGEITDWSARYPEINSVRYILEDSKGNIWVSSNKTIFKKAFQSTEFHELETLSDTWEPVEVYCLKEDTYGNIWAGTYGKGLIHLNSESEEIKVYNTEHGLPGNNIFGIMEDNAHNLWLTTNNGLSKFYPDSLSIRNYGVKDGLLGLEASYNSYYKNSSGKMFFGGIWGLTSFHPDSIAENGYAPQVVLTNLTLFNQQVKIGDGTGLLDKDISISESITFKPDQNNFTIEFAMLNYVQSDKNTFAYRLGNFEDEWNIVDRSYATYTNLVPGEYTFQVKGANNDGIWNHTPTEIKIVVLAPWWKRSFAYFIYFIIIATALFGVIYYSKQRLRLLHGLELEKIEKAKKDEIHQLKLQYFTNISHEIRTPLTLIAAPVEELLAKGFENAFLQKNLKLIKSNVQHIQKLIDQLLDFRKQETGNLRLEVAEGDIVNFIREITLTFKSYAAQKGIYINFKGNEKIKLWYDRDQLEKVFYNLLSNAVKYGSKNIEVDIYKREESVFIEIIDDGIGIETEDIDQIFKRYYMVNHSSVKEKSTGIGLALVKGILEMHQGKISVESDPKGLTSGGNTKFTVELLTGCEHFSEDQIINDFEDSESISRYHQLYAETTETISSNSGPLQADAKNQTILLVEDNKDIIDYLQSIFEQEYQILKAGNGREGLHKAKEYMPDLIISDVMMPEIDGHELSKFLKSDIETSHIPIILLTARTNLIHQVAGLETGADDYITKPFNILLLKTKVKNLIQSRVMMRNIFSNQIYLQPKNITITPPDEAFLTNALEIVEKNMSDSAFNVNVFVKEMGMSRPVLFRKVKALTNLSIVEFIKSIRLKRAAQLIKESDFNINEIAFQVGYDDPKYFSKSFKKQFDHTPTEFKKNNFEKPESLGQENLF